MPPGMGRMVTNVDAKTDAENSDSAHAGEAVPAADGSPRIDFTPGWRNTVVRPPARPFGARSASRSNPFFAGPQAGGEKMSDKFSSDRMAAFTPQISKRVADIPNLASVR